MTNKSTVSASDLLVHEPITANQVKAYTSWDEGDNLVLAGSAGTGKTFVALYLALEAVLEKGNEYRKIILVRSVVPTRDIGYLPGSLEEKTAPYEAAYKNICTQILDDPAAYNKLVSGKQLEFTTTSFIRGMTIDNSIIIVDEMQNLNFHELDSVITRVGENTRIIFSGDYHQSDFKDGHERDGIQKFLRIVEQLKNFEVVTFSWQDIVRSGFLRDYIMTKEMLGYK
jgi:predicted ribonuclease YlaK